MVLDSLDDDIRSTAAQLAGSLIHVSPSRPRLLSRKMLGGKIAYRCAGLDEELAHRVSVVHGVKGSYFVHSHRRHLQQTSDLVHDTDAGEAVLSLAQVEQGHDGSLLVLLGVSLKDLGHEGFILLVEFEGNVGVVVRGISVLHRKLSADIHGSILSSHSLEGSISSPQIVQLTPHVHIGRIYPDSREWNAWQDVQSSEYRSAGKL